MANSILTPQAVTREFLRILHQKLNFVGSIVRDYDSRFAKEGAKIGDTLKIRLPNQYTVTSGKTLVTQDTTENSVSLQVSSQKHVGMNFSTAELALSLDDFSKRIIEPAATVLAANVEADALSMYKDVYNSIWNGGAAATYNRALDARVLLQRALAPVNDRTALMDPLAMADVVKDTKSLFNNQSEIGGQYREGYMGRAAGFDWAENTLLPSHLRGASGNTTANTTALVNGQTTLPVPAGAGAFKKGDVITVVGLNMAHPETKTDVGVLQQFVVTADYAGGAGNLPVSPTIYTSGAMQNVVAAATGATQAVTVAGTASTAVQTSLLYQKEAFAFATADLVMPQGVDFSARENVDGISLRVVRQYDINNDNLPCRVDVLYGYKTLRPQLATRYHNN